MIEWKKRGARSNTQISDRMIWRSVTGNYEVQEYISRFENTDDGRPAVHYLSLRSNNILGRHRKKTAAYAACEKDAKKRNA